MSRSLFSSTLCIAGIALGLTSCTELQNSASSLTSGAATGSASAPQEKMSKHDAALRFLTAYIRLDREMALRYADLEAVSKLDWNVSHAGNIPYYDDKMLLQFRNGWARVYFQEIDGSYRVSDLEVHRKG